MGFFDTVGDLLGVSVGGSAGGSVLFGAPEGLAVSNGTLAVADWANGQVDQFVACPIQLSPTMVITPLPTATPGFTSTYSPTGSITYTPTSTPTSTVTATPTNTAFASLTPEGTPTITFTPTSTPTAFLASCPYSGFSWTPPNPFGVAMDNKANVYVTDDTLDEVDVFNPDGNSYQWGIQGIGNGQFNEPTGIAVDGQGNVYVADSGNNRIQVFNSQSQYVTQWGSAGATFVPFGNPYFDYPVGIAVNSAGTSIFVADSDNGRVQVLNSQGTAVTQWFGWGQEFLTNPGALL